MHDLLSILKRTFAYESFRQCQEEIIASVLEGQDTLGVLPTGAGKSLCYQIPSMLLAKPTLVISPLIALMKDQLEGLPAELAGRAVLINSSLEAEELEIAKQEIASGRKTLIFAAPERLRQGSFLTLLKHVGLSLLVIDEAHCVSVWGHDFRPDYLFIRKALDALVNADITPIVLALTATATLEMQDDISVQLGRSLKPFQGELYRPNLQLEVKHCSNSDLKAVELLKLCMETQGAIVVYANSKDRCERLALMLQKKKISAAYYHAGMSREERKETQEAFMSGKTRIIVATVAFGMGIDKADVRMVVHFTLPYSLESYTQEAGRSGRDGNLSRCVMLYATGDKANLTKRFKQEEMKLETIRQTYLALKERIGNQETGRIDPGELLTAALGEGAGEEWGAESKLRVAISILEIIGLIVRQADAGRSMQIQLLPPPKTTKKDTENLLAERHRISAIRLERMVEYAESARCRHAMILHHFGAQMEACKTSCDFCLGISAPSSEKKTLPPDGDKVPDIGRVILETMINLPFSVGRTSLAKALVGLETGPLNKERCDNFWVLTGFTRSTVIGFIDLLKSQNLIEMTLVQEFPVLAVAENGFDVLESEAMILANPLKNSGVSPGKSNGSETEKGYVGEQLLFEKFRRWRKSEADRLKVPPFLVMHDSTLRAIISFHPKSASELALVPGVGSRKLEAYGEALVEILAQSVENI